MYPTLARNPDYTRSSTPRHRARLRALPRRRAREAAPRSSSSTRRPSRPREGSHPNVRPDLVLGGRRRQTVMQDEIFGPILPVSPTTDLDEAIAFVNDRPRPLALYYFGHDRADVDRVLDETASPAA
jgi:coniferyl-aldehyde dehydrogenase